MRFNYRASFRDGSGFKQVDVESLLAKLLVKNAATDINVVRDAILDALWDGVQSDLDEFYDMPIELSDISLKEFDVEEITLLLAEARLIANKPLPDPNQLTLGIQ